MSMSLRALNVAASTQAFTTQISMMRGGKPIDAAVERRFGGDQ